MERRHVGCQAVWLIQAVCWSDCGRVLTWALWQALTSLARSLAAVRGLFPPLWQLGRSLFSCLCEALVRSTTAVSSCWSSRWLAEVGFPHYWS